MLPVADLRDYFAAQAMSGWMRCYSEGDAWSDYEDFAKSCYCLADVMLRERAK